MKYKSISIEIIKRAATLIIANFVADSLLTGVFIIPIIPNDKDMSEINASTWKSIINGNMFVYGKIKNEIVANNPEIAMILNPNSRPLRTIHVILPPNLSPSISGI